MVSAIETVNGKIIDAQTEIENYKNAIVQLYVEAFEREATRYSNLLGIRQKTISALENQIQLLEAQGYIADRAFYDKQIEQTEKSIVGLEKERTALVSKLEEGMANGVKKGSDEWYKMVDAINAVDEQIQNSKISVEQYRDAIIKTYTALFERAQKVYTDQQGFRDSAISKMSNENSMLEAQGYIASRGVYQAQIETTEQSLNSLEEKRIELTNRLNTAMKNGVQEGSEEWLKMVTAIDAVDLDIQKARQSILEYNKAITKTYTDLFDREAKYYSNMISMRQKATDAISNQISLLEAQGYIASRELYDTQIAQTSKNITSLEKERLSLVHKLNDAIANGVKKGSDEWLNMVNAINEVDANIQNAKISVEQMKRAIVETYTALFERNEKKFSRQIETRQKALSAIGQQIEILEAQGYIANRKLYEKQLTQIQRNITTLEDERTTLVNRLNDGLANGVKKGSDEWYNMVTAIEEVDSQIQAANLSVIQTKKSIIEMYKALFDRAAKQASTQISMRDMAIDAMQKQIEVAESAGELPGVSLYEKQLDQRQKELIRLESERKELMKRMSTATKNGIEVGSDEWVDMVKSLNDVDTAIQDCTISMNELEDAILAINDATFERIQNRFASFQDELSNMLDMYSDKDVATEDNKWTKEGLVQLGLSAQQYEIARESASQYGEQIAELNKNYAAGKYSVTEYTEKLADLQSKQWSSVKTAESARKAMLELNKARVDIVVEGIEKETEAYQKLISEQKEALQSEKDLNDYKRSVEDANKDIAKIEQQLAAIQNDNSLAANAKRLKLEEELSEAKQNLADIEANHQYETTVAALDQQATDYEEARNKEIETLQASLEQEEQILSESYARIKENAALIGDEILLKIQELGLQMSTELTSPWENGQLAIAAYNENLVPTTSALIEQLLLVEQQEWSLQTQADKTASSIAAGFSKTANDLVTEIGKANEELKGEESAANKAADAIAKLFTKDSTKLVTEIEKANNKLVENEVKANNAAIAIANLFAQHSTTLISDLQEANRLLDEEEEKAQKAADRVAWNFQQDAARLCSQIENANLLLEDEERDANNAGLTLAALFDLRAEGLIDDLEDINENLEKQEEDSRKAAEELAKVFDLRATELIQNIKDAWGNTDNLKQAANYAAGALSNAIDGSYSGASATKALGAIGSAADDVKDKADAAADSLGKMLDKLSQVPSNNDSDSGYHITTTYGPGTDQYAWKKNADGTITYYKNPNYATGSKRITHDQLAWTQEEGPEMIISPTSSAILTPLQKNDMVLPADQTAHIWEWSKFNPTEFASKLIQSVRNVGTGQVQTNTMQVGSLITVNGSINDTQEMVMIAAQQASTKIKQSFRELSNGLTG